jgi:S-adenosylmethionine/arginine decarboxylase-like enzyme
MDCIDEACNADRLIQTPSEAANIIGTDILNIAKNDYGPARASVTFRADIVVSTCGMIPPLKALNYLIHGFESDIVMMDCRARFYPRRFRRQALHGSQNQFHPELHPGQHQGSLPDDRRQHLPGTGLPHQDGAEPF